jgi:hypothetical protein
MTIMKITQDDYSIHNRMEGVAAEAVYRLLAENSNVCGCAMCREDMTAYLLNQIPAVYVPILADQAQNEPLVLEQLENQLFRKVIVEAYRAVHVVRSNPRHEHDRAAMQNCTELMVLSPLNDILNKEGLQLGRDELSQIMAGVLNMLEPHYTTSNKGHAYVRTAELDSGEWAKFYCSIYDVLKRLAILPS